VRKRELKTVTFEEVQKHNTKKDCWLVVDDLVYDVSKFIPHHPGGSILARYAGQDATDAFYAFHGEEPGSPGITALPRYLVGKLAEPIALPGYLSDFRALRKQVASEGLMRVNVRWYLSLLAFYASLYVSSLLLLWYLPHNVWSTLLSGTFFLHTSHTPLLSVASALSLATHSIFTTCTPSHNHTRAKGSRVASCVSGPGACPLVSTVSFTLSPPNASHSPTPPRFSLSFECNASADLDMCAFLNFAQLSSALAKFR